MKLEEKIQLNETALPIFRMEDIIIDQCIW